MLHYIFMSIIASLWFILIQTNDVSRINSQLMGENASYVIIVCQRSTRWWGCFYEGISALCLSAPLYCKTHRCDSLSHYFSVHNDTAAVKLILLVKWNLLADIYSPLYWHFTFTLVLKMCYCLKCVLVETTLYHILTHPGIYAGAYQWMACLSHIWTLVLKE